MGAKKIAIMGDGSWGTALAILLSKKGYAVRLWSAFPDYAKILDKERENTKFLPSIKIPEQILITHDAKEATGDAGVVVLAIPAQYLRDVIKNLRDIDFSNSIIVNVAKGIENTTLMRMSEAVKTILGLVKYVVLSGPTIAQEVAQGLPAVCVASSLDNSCAQEVQEAFTTDRFRIYTSSDVIGVELGGALKNIIAIATGISDGLNFGVNAKAALLTRGMVEITRLGVVMGAKQETFSGLSGMGDLITTCFSVHGRNWWAGTEIAKGKNAEQVQKMTPMVIEGIATTVSAHELAKKFKVEMPITEQVHAVLFRGKSPRQAVNELMMRERKEEVVK